METEQKLFDESLRVTDEAIAQANANAPKEWKQAALWAVRAVACSQPLFTTDDVHAMLHELAVPVPHEPRALGAIMRQAAQSGYCRATDTYRKSQRIEAHRGPKRVWASQLAVMP